MQKVWAFVRGCFLLLRKGSKLYYTWLSALLVLIAIGVSAYTNQMYTGLIVTAGLVVAGFDDSPIPGGLHRSVVWNGDIDPRMTSPIVITRKGVIVSRPNKDATPEHAIGTGSSFGGRCSGCASQIGRTI